MRQQISKLSELPKGTKFFVVTGKDENLIGEYDYCYYHATKRFFSFYIKEKPLTITKNSGNITKKEG